MGYSEWWNWQRSHKAEIGEATRAALGKLSVKPGPEKRREYIKNPSPVRHTSSYARRDADPDPGCPPYLAYRDLRDPPQPLQPRRATKPRAATHSSHRHHQHHRHRQPPLPTDSSNIAAAPEQQEQPPQPPRGPRVPYTGPGVAGRAEEALRRDYQRLYGGSFSLQDYYKIHRSAARCHKFATAEPQRVLHRRGSLAVYENRLPRETAVDRIEAAYNVGIAQEVHYARRGEEPYIHYGTYGRSGADEDFVKYPTLEYDERDFVRMYAERNRHADEREREDRERQRHKRRGREGKMRAEKAGAPFFDIPPSNRDDRTQYVVEGFVNSPKLKRRTVGGKAITHVPVAQMPESDVFDFF